MGLSKCNRNGSPNLAPWFSVHWLVKSILGMRLYKVTKTAAAKGASANALELFSFCYRNIRC